jgi:hypothetical protein
MAKRFLSSLKLLNLSSDPQSGSSGEIYYNTNSDVVKYHDGFQWKNLSGEFSLESGPFYPNTSLENGKLFYNTSNGRTAIYFNSVWKEFSYLTDLPLDGGLYNTTIFDNSIDGGTPTTYVFVGEYDGGTL